MWNIGRCITISTFTTSPTRNWIGWCCRWWAHGRASFPRVSKAITEGILRDAAQLRFGEPELPRGQFILAAERCGENGGIVAVEGDRYTGIEEAPHGMC